MMFSSSVVDVVDVDKESVANVTHKMESKGAPQAQARPRRGNGGVFYNPNCRVMTAFKAKIKGGIPVSPIFGVKPAAVDIKLFMRRPNTHFKGDNRSNQLKTNLPLAHTMNPGIDNLVKFVLDGMNKLVCQDDKQAAKLTVLKLCDSEEGCDGRTVVEVALLDV